MQAKAADCSSHVIFMVFLEYRDVLMVVREWNEGYYGNGDDNDASLGAEWKVAYDWEHQTYTRTICCDFYILPG